MQTQATETIETEVLLPPAYSLNRARVLARLLALLLPQENRWHCLSQMECALTTGNLTPAVALVPARSYDWERDILSYPGPPITVIDVLSPTQAFYAVAYNLRHLYLVAGVQSAWLVVPILSTVYLLLPDDTIQTFAAGSILHDPASGVELHIDQLFR